MTPSVVRLLNAKTSGGDRHSQLRRQPPLIQPSAQTDPTVPNEHIVDEKALAKRLEGGQVMCLEDRIAQRKTPSYYSA